MSYAEVLLFLHILGAFLMVAAAGVSTAVGIMAARTSNPRTMVNLLDLQARAEWFVTTPGALIAILFGSLLVDEAGFEFGDSWLTLAYIFWVVVLGLNHGMMIPFNRKLRRRAQGMVDEKVAESAELMAEAGSIRTMLVRLALDGSLVIFVYLMVAKPGLS